MSGYNKYEEIKEQIRQSMGGDLVIRSPLVKSPETEQTPETEQIQTRGELALAPVTDKRPAPAKKQRRAGRQKGSRVVNGKVIPPESVQEPEGIRLPVAESVQEPEDSPLPVAELDMVTSDETAAILQRKERGEQDEREEEKQSSARSLFVRARSLFKRQSYPFGATAGQSSPYRALDPIGRAQATAGQSEVAEVAEVDEPTGIAELTETCAGREDTEPELTEPAEQDKAPVFPVKGILLAFNRKIKRIQRRMKARFRFAIKKISRRKKKSLIPAPQSPRWATARYETLSHKTAKTARNLTMAGLASLCLAYAFSFINITGAVAQVSDVILTRAENEPAYSLLNGSLQDSLPNDSKKEETDDPLTLIAVKEEEEKEPELNLATEEVKESVIPERNETKEEQADESGEPAELLPDPRANLDDELILGAVLTEDEDLELQLMEIEIKELKLEVLKKQLSRRMGAETKETAPQSPVNEKGVSRLASYISAVRSSVGNSAVSEDEINRIAEGVYKYAAQYNLPAGLVVGIMQTESNFRPGAISSADARGLMQVMWKYHYARLQAVGIQTKEELHDIDKGIKAGCIVLSGYIEAEKSITKALGRYYGVLHQQYVSTVKSYWETWELVDAGMLEDREWKAAVEKTRTAWNNLFARVSTSNKTGSAGAKAASAGAKTTAPARSSSSSAVAIQNDNRDKSTSTMVYNNKITIKKTDGTTKTWTDAGR